MPLLGPAARRALCVADAGLRGARASGTACDYGSRSCSPPTRPRWFWHVHVRQPGNAAAQQSISFYAQDLGARAVRRRAHERVLRQPVPRPAPLQHRARGWASPRGRTWPVDGRNPVAADRLAAQRRVVRDRCAAAARLAARAARRRRAGRRPARHAAAARARDGRDPGRGAARSHPAPAPQLGFFGWSQPDHPGAAAPPDLALRRRRAGAARSARQPGRSASPAARRARPRRCSPARRVLAVDRPRRRGALDDLFRRAPPRGARRRRRAALVLPRRRRHVVLRAKELRVQRPHGHMLRTGRHARARRNRADLDRVDGRRLPFDGDAGPRQHQPLPVDACAAISACSARTGCACSSRSTARWHLLGVPSAFEMRPSAAAGSIARRRHDRGRRRARAMDEHDAGSARARAAKAAPLPMLASLTSRSTATTAARPAPPAGDSTSRRRLRRRAAGQRARATFPRGRLSHRAGRRQPLRPRRRRRAAVRQTAARAASRSCASTAHAPIDFGLTHPRRTGRRATAAARRRCSCAALAARRTPSAARARRHPALVRAQRARALPLAARARAVLRRRLGHARRLPGPGRDAAGARPARADARPAAARVRGAEPRRRLAAVVHVLRARARHPRRRLARRHRVLAAARRWRDTCSPPATRALLDEALPFHDDGGDASTLWQHVERALARDRGAPHRRHRISRPTATATGTTRCSRPTRRCASACAAPGP